MAELTPADLVALSTPETYFAACVWKSNARYCAWLVEGLMTFTQLLRIDVIRNVYEPSKSFEQQPAEFWRAMGEIGWRYLNAAKQSEVIAAHRTWHDAHMRDAADSAAWKRALKDGAIKDGAKAVPIAPHAETDSRYIMVYALDYSECLVEVPPQMDGQDEQQCRVYLGRCLIKGFTRYFSKPEVAALWHVGGRKNPIAWATFVNQMNDAQQKQPANAASVPLLPAAALQPPPTAATPPVEPVSRTTPECVTCGAVGRCGGPMFVCLHDDTGNTNGYWGIPCAAFPRTKAAIDELLVRGALLRADYQPDTSTDLMDTPMNYALLKVHLAELSLGLPRA